MYRNVRLVRQDMDQIQNWEKDWLMNFNASKCQTIHFTRKHKPITERYTIHGEDLESVENATYLGVKLNSTAAWGQHCNSTSKKAECTQAFLQRNLTGTPRQIIQVCYKTLLRSILEYASTVWEDRCREAWAYITKIRSLLGYGTISLMLQSVRTAWTSSSHSWQASPSATRSPGPYK